MTSQVCLLSSFILLSIFPDSPFTGLTAVSSLTLFGLIRFLERKELAHLEDFEARLKTISDRLEGLTIARQIR